MATKAEKPNDSAAQAAEDLAVVFAENTVSIANRSITVQEYPFLTWLQLKPKHQGFLSALAELIGASAEGVLIDDLMDCFEQHIDDVQALLCASCDLPKDFLETLNSDDFELLLMTWWQVNRHFFLKSVHRQLRKAQTNTPSVG